jgi:acetyl-CoA carboxylase carboxyl transferase subunit alpha
LGIIDEIIPEPLGGAHREPAAVMQTLKQRLLELLPELSALPVDELLAARYAKFRAMGALENVPPEETSAAAGPA